MPTTSLAALESGLEETRDLLRLVPAPSAGRPNSVAEARAVLRASVVNLSGHFEAYVYGLNVEAVAALNLRSVDSRSLTIEFRLLHSRPTIDLIAGASWDRPPRAVQLTEFVQKEAWLWQGGGSGPLDPDRLLTWMKAPRPVEVVRYFRYWGIDDAFSAITRAQTVRSRLWRLLDEMVTRRNDIAHGDPSVSATIRDVRDYLQAVGIISTRIDRLMARALVRLTAPPSPW